MYSDKTGSFTNINNPIKITVIDTISLSTLLACNIVTVKKKV